MHDRWLHERGKISLRAAEAGQDRTWSHWISKAVSGFIN
jgi:hypothetical protein